jgi:hypothetical protein
MTYLLRPLTFTDKSKVSNGPSGNHTFSHNTHAVLSLFLPPGLPGALRRSDCFNVEAKYSNNTCFNRPQLVGSNWVKKLMEKPSNNARGRRYLKISKIEKKR